MNKIYHLEVNGKTNTCVYVSKIVTSVYSGLDKSTSVQVFTSEESYYEKGMAIPLFRKYGVVSNPVLKLFYYITGFWKVYLYLKKEKSLKTILHLHWLKLSLFDLLVLSMIKSKLSTQLVFTVHNVLPHESNFIDRIIYPYIYKKIDLFTFHTVGVRKKLIESMALEVNNFKIIPHYGNKVSLSNLAPIKNTLLFFGSIREYKGLDILIKACSLLPDDLDWTLSIYGKQEMDISALKKKSDEYRISDKVKWHTGWVYEDEIDKIFHEHEVIILPYKHIDNSGLLYLAMSYGKPLIASNIGSLSDIIENGRNGLIFEAGNAKELSAKITELLNDDNLKKEMGKSALFLMNSEHSLNRIGQLHRELYTMIL